MSDEAAFSQYNYSPFVNVVSEKHAYLLIARASLIAVCFGIGALVISTFWYVGPVFIALGVLLLWKHHAVTALLLSVMFAGYSTLNASIVLNTILADDGMKSAIYAGGAFLLSLVFLFASVAAVRAIRYARNNVVKESQPT